MPVNPNRRIKVRWSSSHWEYPKGDGIRVRIWTECATGMPAEVFAYRMLPKDPQTGEENGFFSHICSPTDLEEYPVNEPLPSHIPRWFRLAYVDVVVRSHIEAEAFINDVLDDVCRLKRSLDSKDVVEPMGQEDCGGDGTCPGSSSLSSYSSSSESLSSVSLGLNQLVSTGTFANQSGYGQEWEPINGGAASGVGPLCVWTEYESNPVHDILPDRAYYPTILQLVDGTYVMWHDTASGVNMATSPDGVTWTDQGTVTGLTNARHTLVKEIDGQYRMWYWDISQLYSINAMRTAVSSDGMTWTSDQAITQVGSTVINPTPSTNWNRGSYGPCDVIYNPVGSTSIVTPTDEASVFANKYIMYYDGTTGGIQQIGLAVSNDGINWEGYNGGVAPVFPFGGPGAWDEDFASRATILKVGTDEYRMWYSGGTGAVNDGIGYATSTDGINWVRNTDCSPIFHKDDGPAWRANRTYTPVVLGDKMWFSGRTAGGDYTIGLATALNYSQCCMPNGQVSKTLMIQGFPTFGMSDEAEIISIDALLRIRKAGEEPGSSSSSASSESSESSEPIVIEPGARLYFFNLYHPDGFWTGDNKANNEVITGPDWQTLTFAMDVTGLSGEILNRGGFGAGLVVGNTNDVKDCCVDVDGVVLQITYRE